MAKTRRQVQKELQQARPQKLPDEFIGYIGDRSGNWNAGGNNIYVRELASGQLVIVKNLTVSPVPGRLVKVQRQAGTLYVVGYWGIYGDADNEEAFVPPHDHRWPDPNFTPIEAAQIVPFNVWPYDGFTVQIFGGVFQKVDGTYGLLSNQTFDLSSYQPTAGAKIVHFQYDEDGVVSVVSGAVLGSKGALTTSAIPEATETSMRVGVSLYDGQESVRRDGLVNDFWDWRFGKPAIVGLSLDTLSLDGYPVDNTTIPPSDGDVLIFDGCTQTWYPAKLFVAQSHIVDADGTLADATTKINAILDALEALGLLETS